MLVFLVSVIGSKGRIGRLWSLFLVLLALLATGYVEALWPALQLRAYRNTVIDLVIGVILIFLVLESTRRAFGLIIPIFTLIVILYPFAGLYFPEPFTTLSMGLGGTISHLAIGLQRGIYGDVLSSSANYIFLFVVYGGLLEAAGGVKFFRLLATLFAGRLQGGPALMAVISGVFIGTITGSVSAAILICGSFAIPLMKSVGYNSEQAGGIQAATSNGAQIMPPIMGIAAFVMAGISGVPYLKIVAMGIIPALLYFYSCGLYVYFQAGKQKVARMAEEKVSIKELLVSAPTFIIPLATIIIVLVMGYTVMMAAFWAIITTIAVAVIRKETRPSVGTFVKGFAEGAKLGAAIGVSCACFGMIETTFSMSGLGVKLSHGIVAWSGGLLFPALLIIWGIIMIMDWAAGVTLVAYIMVAIFGVAALTKMGVPYETAHFFAMYASCCGPLTPPVASAALVACKLSGGGYFKTSIEATKAGIGIFVIPFMFVYVPLLLLMPKEPIWEIIAFIAILICFLALQVGFVGYYFKECNLWERVLALTSALLLLAFLPLHNYLLLGVGVALFALVTLWQWRKRSLAKSTLELSS
jgi:TRAP transporter 4TM/12TM fusion protein